MRCDDTQELVWALAAGELATPAMSLRRQAVEGHLASCASCASSFAELAAMRAAVRGYEPAVSAAELSHLAGRLAPYMDASAKAPTPARGVLVALCGALVAVGVAVLLVAGPWRPETSASGTQSPHVVSAPRSWEPAPFVRVVASGGSMLREHVVGERVSVALVAGEAAFSFRGGAGRALSVTTAFGAVEVVGTRFAVALRDDGMQVQVAEGEVRVVSASGVMALVAGSALTVSATGEWVDTATPSPLLDDAELVRHHAQREARDPDASPVARASPPTLRSRANTRGATLDRVKATPDGAPEVTLTVHAEALLAELDAAERLAKAGQVTAALAAYRAIATRAAPGLETYRDLARFEMARLYGFALGDKERARAVFLRLMERGDEEVHTQAALSLCELERDVPCAALACLSELARDTARRDLASEARRLMQSWGLRGEECR